jgi:hypothetical protein
MHPDINYDWYEVNGDIIKMSSNTITPTKDYSDNMQTYIARPSYKGMVFPADTVKLYPSLDRKPYVRDIRIELCPSPARSVYLTSHLDSLDYYSAVEWSKVNAFTPSFLNPLTGELNSDDFPSHGIFTYRYTRKSECGTELETAKAYVHVPNGKTWRRHDTVLICVANTGVININSIFGLELGGSLTRDTAFDPDNVVHNNTVTVDPSSQHAGALLFNIKDAHSDADADYSVNYRGISGKRFVFEYVHTTSVCNSGTTQIVIVSYE